MGRSKDWRKLPEKMFKQDLKGCYKFLQKHVRSKAERLFQTEHRIGTMEMFSQVYYFLLLHNT